jgi:hypothetical protein
VKSRIPAIRSPAIAADSPERMAIVNRSVLIVSPAGLPYESTSHGVFCREQAYGYRRCSIGANFCGVSFSLCLLIKENG